MDNIQKKALDALLLYKKTVQEEYENKIEIIDESIKLMNGDSVSVKNNYRNKENIEKTVTEMKYILSYKAPLKRADILKELYERGWQTKSQYPCKYIGTILWRNQNIFEHDKKLGYFLNENEDVK